MRKTTSVSIEGDRILTLALHRLAEDNNMTVGKLVTDAVFDKHRDQLEPLLSFFRKRDSENCQLVTEADNA